VPAKERETKAAMIRLYFEAMILTSLFYEKPI